jgi:uncharacterized protein with von Willebrand factor type A (vWA) domain
MEMSTVLMIDVATNMICMVREIALRLPKKVAMALAELILTRYQKTRYFLVFWE